jgi:integrase/recombinase XerD
LEAAKPLNPKRHIPPKRHIVTPEGLQKLINACESLTDRTLVTVLANTGLRASELCNLQMSDIDLENRFLTVRCGKGGKMRKVGLNHAAIEVLSQYMAEMQGTATSNRLLFRNTNNKQMNRSGLYQRLERIGLKAGVKVSPHALRRAFVTIRANEGKPIQMLQMACGHSDIKTTMSYCRTSENELINAMKNW